MIYTKRYPIKFPNGRNLKDDVALLTCEQGDCALVEGAVIDSPQWPRATENDKPFKKEFPYLAEVGETTSPLPPPASRRPSRRARRAQQHTTFFRRRPPMSARRSRWP